MRRHLLPLWLLASVALGCVERARVGPEPTSPPSEPGTTEPGQRIPDVTRDTGVFLRTAGLRYRLRRESTGLAVDIPYRYTNPRPRAVFLPACRADTTPLPPVLEQELLPGKWVRAWSTDRRNCLLGLRPLVMAPGEIQSDTLHVRAAYASDSVTAFTVDPPEGVYRLVWNVLASYDTAVAGFGPVLPVTERLSNRFVLDPP